VRKSRERGTGGGVGPEVNHAVGKLKSKKMVWGENKSQGNRDTGWGKKARKKARVDFKRGTKTIDIETRFR